MGSEAELLEEMNKNMALAVLPVTIFVGIEVAVGFVGNLLVIYVYLFRYHTCNFRYFVLCLALLDFASTATTMPGEIITQQNWYAYPLPVFCKVKSFFNIFTVAGEALCLCIIAVDRYRKVCAPFGWQIKARHALLLCGVILAISAILASPVPFFWGVTKQATRYKDTVVNATLCEKDRNFINSNAPFIYVTIAEVGISICLLVMFVLYIFVAKKLILNERRFRRHSVPKCAYVRTSSTPSTANALGSVKSRTEESYCSMSDEVTQVHSQQEDASEKQIYLETENSLDFSSDIAVDMEDVRSETMETVDKYHPDQNRTQKLKTFKECLKVHRQRLNKVRRKTFIMIIVTTVFIITCILYLTLLAFISRADDILWHMNDNEKAAYFFFFRLVFINHVINPIIYGCLDQQFKAVLSDVTHSILRVCHLKSKELNRK
ncbi:D(1A) dopamine receptor-like [Dreissena polymorpha]|uniref:G-protein coupled receptors family 1 profile domain-containing protein n=1 Tax=Dreissena polymorpha TaxID=45954 RepID=A0A9D3YV08_DREPO|nr:D(1A) dopamine receptor-like [Dreissena polymorpha]KAH3707873.1 hypothetical protein DPMN_067292 [Dreissena polymorpha]